MDAKRLEDAHTLIQSMRTEGPVQPGQFTYDVLLFACQRDCIDGLIDGKLIITILTEVRPFAWLPSPLMPLKMVPHDGQIPNFRIVRVQASTRYNRGDGNRRASRNGLVSDLPPETPTVTIRNLFRRRNTGETP